MKLRESAPFLKITKPTRHLFIKQRFQAGLAVLLSIVLLFLLYRYWQYTKSPDYVLHRALHDIEIGDINDLYAISNQDACKYLHITPQNARLILQQTLWAQGFPQDPTCEPFGPVPQGIAQWLVTWKHPHYKVKQHMGVAVLERPNGRWYFDLPQLLEMSCNMTGKSYASLASQVGIKGMEGMDEYWDLKGNLLSATGVPPKESSAGGL
jgi:hypothetical protein